MILITEWEKLLLEKIRQLKGPELKEDFLSRAEAMKRAQEALAKDFGLPLTSTVEEEIQL